VKGNPPSASKETEIKLEAGARRVLEASLRRLGFRVARRRRFERNVLLDFGDRRLAKSGCLLRLRIEDDGCPLTFKGPPRPSPRYKIRPEIEVGLKPEATRSLRTILRAAGLREFFRYEKFRTAYAVRSPARARQGLAFYDETPVGNYLELEGTPRWIDRTARSLGRSPEDYITASYRSLYCEACRRRGVKPGNMVFRERAGHKRKT
jgi:adenylate cyclase class 2